MNSREYNLANYFYDRAKQHCVLVAEIYIKLERKLSNKRVYNITRGVVKNCRTIFLSRRARARASNPTGKNLVRSIKIIPSH